MRVKNLKCMCVLSTLPVYIVVALHHNALNSEPSHSEFRWLLLKILCLLIHQSINRQTFVILLHEKLGVVFLTGG